MDCWEKKDNEMCDYWAVVAAAVDILTLNWLIDWLTDVSGRQRRKKKKWKVAVVDRHLQ